MKIEDLKPQLVFKYFSEICKIPRGSGNEKQISNYLTREGKKLGLEVVQDEHYNVLIKKKATPGYENAPTVIIQGHMDMVGEKNKDTDHGTIHTFFFICCKYYFQWRMNYIIRCKQC